jgi:hypothetical protein
MNMKYRAIPQDRAKAVLEKIRAGGEIELTDFETRGEGKELAPSTIAKITKALDKIREKKYPSTLRHKDPRGGEFEGEVCAILHEELALDVSAAADYDFWTWLALENSHLVEWRFGNASKPALDANYGVGDSRENLFYRMWLRADIGRSQIKGDEYALARRGGNDFWRSHILRIDYGKCRAVAQALLKSQFPTDKAKPKWNTDHVRDVAKRLTRLNPTLLFESLDEKAATNLIQREASLSSVAKPK